MITVLIMAAGQGLRMLNNQPKQYLMLAGQPILTRTLQAVDACTAVNRIFLVVASTEIDYCRSNIIARTQLNKSVTLVAGGRRRQDSVYNGLQAIDGKGIVLIHDGVRPFIDNALINACIQGALTWDACIPAIPVVETLKQANVQNEIVQTVPRQGLYMAQTPQAFKLELIKAAHTQAHQQARQATDDAQLVEHLGQKVQIIPGYRENIKITTPEDLRYAEILYQHRNILKSE